MNRSQDRWLALALIAAVALVYFPAWRGDFLWDDDGHVTAPALQSLSGLGRIWLEPGATQQYYPVLHSAFWFEHRLWGDNPLGYHLVNVALHACSACLLGLILRRLAIPGAWLAAAIFALHPVQVESVAWISEQKNTLSGIFYLASALVFLRFHDTRQWQSYAWALFLFVLAVLSKSVTATLPAALLVVLWWRHGRLEWQRDVKPLAPWLVAGAAVGLFTTWAERRMIGATGAGFDLTLPERLLLAGRAPWFYLRQLFWPANLVFIYPRWTPASWVGAAGLAALATVFVLAWRARKRHRGPLAALLFFVGTLFPVLGFFNIYPFLYSFVADHWQYLACIGVITPVAALAAGAAQWSARFPAVLLPAVVGGVVLALGCVTFTQSGNYRDNETFYRAIIARNPDAWFAHNNLGAYYAAAGENERALPYFRAALQLNPGYNQAKGNLGSALVNLGRPADALPWLEDALRQPDPRQMPNLILTEANYGVALAQVGRIDEAIPLLRQALATDPHLAAAQNALGFALERAGHLDDAESAYRAALRENPQLALAHFNLAGLLARRERIAEAEKEYRQGLEAEPANADALRDLAVLLLYANRAAEAIAPAEAALRLRPDVPEAHRLVADVLVRSGRAEESLGPYRETLRLAPTLGGVHADLAAVLLQLGRTTEAFAECEAALRQKPDDPVALSVLRELRNGRK